MARRILWFDNDPGVVESYIKTLRERKYHVDIAATVTEAERAVNEHEYDLVILDAMIPTKSAEEEKIYAPSETDTGHETGLVFYRRHKEKFVSTHTPVLVMTVRLDADIAKKFAAAGLPPNCFKRRLEFRDGQVFLRTVSNLIDARLITQ